jgi:hypothetical protein
VIWGVLAGRMGREGKRWEEMTEMGLDSNREKKNEATNGDTE